MASIPVTPSPAKDDIRTTTSASNGRILVIDDEPAIRESLYDLLTGEGYSVDLAVNAAEGEMALMSRVYDLVLLDMMMPDRSGLELLESFRERDRDTPVFLVTAYASVESAVRALKLGANDFVSKPWNNNKLIIEIERVITSHRLVSENRLLKRALKQRYNFPNIIGKSERMLRMLDLVEQVAPSRSTILVTGESGTGKELVAKAIHYSSPRAEQPFVIVNSASIPNELLESTLFGHMKGSFTGAIQSRKGSFEIANRGTIFLDEIGDISQELQAKLLRVLQEREFTPLGSNETIKVDVRILAATNADLHKMVQDGKFREDLYYRLNVINIPLPPLRERKEDIPLLVEFFFDKYCQENGKFLDSRNKSSLRFAPEAMQIIMEHNWPGNVRELENIVERAAVLASEQIVPVDVFPDYLLQASGIRTRRDNGPLPPDASLFEIVADYERNVIIGKLEQCSWSQTETAEALRVPLSTLNQKIKRLSIEIKKARG
jgi:DNA-binding NtrC family response regulator